MQDIKKFWHKAWWSKAIIITIGSIFWPLLITFLASHPLSKIQNARIKWSLLALAWIISFFITNAWIRTFVSPPSPTNKVKSPSISTKTSQTPVSTPSSESSPTPSPTTTEPVQSPPQTSSLIPQVQEVQGKQLVKVTKVIDGDTIEIEGGIRVRYIGINTPETVDPRKPVECFGGEASNKNKELVEGKTIQLEKDISETDKYGRLLRYVLVGDIFVNDFLVRQGYAYATSYPPDIKHQDQLRQAEREARENSMGLWTACTQTTSPPTTQPTPTPLPGQNCHPSYPDVCISPPPPDLDCPNIPYRRFRVLQPDPHRFDSDYDGIGCEI